MRDLEAIQDQEILQQELVRTIINSIYNLPVDGDPKWLRTFTELAFVTLKHMLFGLNGGEVHASDFEMYILGPINQFTEDKAERKYLLTRVLTEVTRTVHNQAINEYHRTQLLAEVG